MPETKQTVYTWLANPAHDLNSIVRELSRGLEGLSLGEIAALSKLLKEKERDLRVIRDDLEARLMKELSFSKNKMATVNGPTFDDPSSKMGAHTYVLTKSVSKRRAQVDHAGLIRKIESIAYNPEGRLDKDTGELIPVSEKALEIYKEAFRFEPRWSVLAGYGVDDEDYCGDTSYRTTVRIET